MKRFIAIMTAAGMLAGATAALAAEGPSPTAGTSGLGQGGGGKSPGMQMQNQGPNGSNYAPTAPAERGAANDTPGAASGGGQTKSMTSNPTPSQGSVSTSRGSE